jgi:predicted alpha-1,2-mannosidase
MKKSKLPLALLALMLTTAMTSCRSQETSPAGYVDPLIGNVAPLLNSNRPVAHLPNQMVRVFPTRQDHLDDQITAFPLTSLNVITPQVVFGVKPAVGQLTDTLWRRRMTYEYDSEVLRPWYYSTYLLEEGVTVEFTPGARTGIYRFTFPEGVRKNLLLTHYYEKGLYEITGGGSEVTGTEFVVDLHHNQQGKAYMYGRFETAPVASGVSEGEKNWGRYTVLGPQPIPREVEGQKAWFEWSEEASGTIEFRYAVSFVSTEQARLNFERELTGVSFEELRAESEQVWERTMGQIRVEGGTEAQKRSFYTSLYRTYVRPMDISEYGSWFSGYDGEVHPDGGRPFLTDDYTWGNFSAMHPLRVILDPEREGQILDSYVRMYEHSGWMPDYPKVYGDREGMYGFHSAVMFLDAWRKGVRGFDSAKALEGLAKSADEATMLPSRNGPKGPLEDFWWERGYYPALHPGEKEDDPVASLKGGQRRSAVAVTQAHSYDGWALGEFAGELGNETARKRYAPLAGNYKNLWNADKGLFLPRDKAGAWIDINPMFEGQSYYNENNAYSYLWYVQHDIPGLIGLMGGKENFERRLDEMFRMPLQSTKHVFWQRFPDMTGMIGQFSVGNEVTYHIPFLYNYTSSPWKAQRWTRFIFDTWFKDDVFGVWGDEDGGAMSAFAVFLGLGFFPVQPGVPMYAISSPVFDRIAIDLPNGKTFTIVATGTSSGKKYIHSARLDGRKLDTLWFSHDDMLRGGTLELEMSDKPLLAE